MWVQMPAAQLWHELTCTSGRSIPPLRFFAIPEETEKPLCLTHSRQRLTSTMCIIKEAYVFHLSSDTNAMKYWRGSGWVEETDHPGLLVQLRWRKHFHCVAICTKSCVTKPTKTNKPQTTGEAKHPYLVWRKLLYWQGSTEELRASCTVLVTPFPAKETSACQRQPLFSPSFPL